MLCFAREVGSIAEHGAEIKALESRTLEVVCTRRQLPFLIDALCCAFLCTNRRSGLMEPSKCKSLWREQ